MTHKFLSKLLALSILVGLVTSFAALANVEPLVLKGDTGAPTTHQGFDR